MEDIASLLGNMTLEEKASLVIGADAWSTVALPRLRLPPLWLADGPHGLRRVPPERGLGLVGLPATCFPTASCLASTWNSGLIEELGRALGDEARALKVDVLLGPGVNMKRTPLCGRNFEYFSEDPFLAGELASAFIGGVQSRGVGTSLKHFAVNNQEHERFTIDAAVEERVLRELYLPAFETAVKKARPWTVMASYNKVNGVASCENSRFLNDILRKEWGFDGLVVSDWGAVQDRVKSLEAGVDLEMPGPREERRRAVVEAVRSGALPETALDRAAERVLRLAERCAAAPKGGAIDQAAHHGLARRLAGEGLVLLKNNGMLPLKKPRRLVVIGRAAKKPYFQGGGSSHVTPLHVDIPLAEIRKRAGAAHVTYCPGHPAGMGLSHALISEAAAEARASDAALLFIALDEHIEAESYDRSSLELPESRQELIRLVCAAQPRTAVILLNGGVVVMGGWIDRAAAVLEAWMPGQAGGGAIADALWGRINPSGRLAETIPRKIEDTPAFLNYPGENGRVVYGEGLFIGYRYYDKKQMPVQFPFGHGLSYTKFEYGSLRFSAKRFRDSDGLEVGFTVANRGKRAGQEVAQVYVHDRAAALPRPPKELKGFCKVALEPGEKKTMTVRLDFRTFAFFHPAYGRFITESGEFEILVGASSADIRLRGTVLLESTLDLPSLLTRARSVRQWLDDPRGRVVVKPLLEKIKAALAKDFRENKRMAGHMLGFILEASLERMVSDWGARLGLEPGKAIGELLEKVNAR